MTWIDSTNILLDLSKVELLEFCSSSRSKTGNGGISTMPYLVIGYEEEHILFHGKKMIRQFLRAAVEDYENAPIGFWTLLMRESGEEFIGAVVDCLPSKGQNFVRVVVSTGHACPLRTGGLWPFYGALSTYPSSINHDFNLDYLNSTSVTQISYSHADWFGKRKAVVPVAYYELTKDLIGIEATIVLYDLNDRIAISSRLWNGVRPHKMYFVKRGVGENTRIRDAVFKAFKKVYGAGKECFSKVDVISTKGMRSTEVDELEYDSYLDAIIR